mmetsp:Transcript_17354/g.27722  ORF Transcript_17354/g.27722 Transcript_17354/m.27722 type:complete len:743 (-) Transcript_17354:274-2502(-)
MSQQGAVKGRRKAPPPPKSPTFPPKEDDGNLPTSEGLPYGWTGPEKDTKTGRGYYRDHKTGKSQWRPPTATSMARHSFPESSRLNESMVNATTGKTHRGTASATISSTTGDVGIDTEAALKLSGASTSTTSRIDATLEEAELPVPPPCPALALPVSTSNQKHVYVCVVKPGLGFRSEPKWESKVEGKGILEGEKVEGVEKKSGWIYVPSTDLHLPVSYDGKTMLTRDKSHANARMALLDDIKRNKGRTPGPRAKLLDEISRGKCLKKAQLRDVGILGVDSTTIQEAIADSIISYDQGIRLWKYFQANCNALDSKATVATKKSHVQLIQEVRSKYSQKELRELIHAMKEKLKPKTMTYVKKKYYNCIAGAEIIFFIGDSKYLKDPGDTEHIGKVLLDDGWFRSASSKKAKNLKGLPIRADQYYRYGDIIIQEGPLERMHKHMFNSSFKKRYYRLIESGYTAKSKRQEYRLESYLKKTDKDAHSIMDITDAILDPIPRLALDFMLKASKEIRLKASSQADKKLWVDTLKTILGSSQTIADKKTATFGSKLSLVPASDENPMIPEVVWSCVEHVRKYGMKTEGVFRKAGLKERVDELKKCFDANIPISLKEKDDVHNAAACLKQWLRELPEPLIPFEKYKEFLAASTTEEYRVLMKKIPEQNRQLLTYLCTFLERLSVNHEITRMHTKNIALVFAPNILRPKVEDAMEAFQSSDKKIDTFSVIIENVYNIFELQSPEKQAIIQFV